MDVPIKTLPTKLFFEISFQFMQNKKTSSSFLSLIVSLLRKPSFIFSDSLNLNVMPQNFRLYIDYSLYLVLMLFI
jgi:hypothetical protein